MKALALLLPLTLMGACTTSAPPASSADTSILPSTGSAIDDTLTAMLGASATTRDRSLRLTYVKLEGDSRCPANAVCVWEGDAETRLRVQTANDALEATVHTRLDPKVLEVGGYKLTLLEVQPYPGTTPTPGKPKVVVRVVR